MATSSLQQSATIYQFPARGRYVEGEAKKSSAGSISRLPGASMGSSWYHQDAIEEAERTRKQ